MKGDKAKLAIAIIGKGAKPMHGAPFGKPVGAGGEMDDDEEEGGEESPEVVAAGEAIAAIKSGDAEGLSAALKNHYELCKAAEGGDEEESY